MSVTQPNDAHLHICGKSDHYHHHRGSCSLDFNFQKFHLPHIGFEVSSIELSVETNPSDQPPSVKISPSFFTNLKDPQIGEIPVTQLLLKTPWCIKRLVHSPFPKITKTTALHWINHKEMVFLGWGNNGELCKDSKLYSIHQSRNKINDDSINYRVEEISKHLKSKSRTQTTGFYVDVQNFQTGIPSYDNRFYVFDEKSKKWEENSKVQGIKPPPTIGSSSVSFQLDGQDMLYVLGGETQNGCGTNDLWCYNLSLRKRDLLNRWRCIITSEVQPPKLHNHCMIRRGDYLIVFGGQYLKSNKLSNQIWGFNLISEHWFQMPTIGELPHLQNCKMTTGLNNSLFIYGGSDLQEETNETLYIYNMKSHHVYYLPPTLERHPGKLEGFEMCYDYDLGKLIIIGGNDVDHKTDLIHDCNENVYTQVHELEWSLLKDFAKPL